MNRPKVGLANGCFDKLHEGHLHLLREARKHCGLLVVAVNSDESVRKLKGEGRPVDPLAIRLDNIWQTDLADMVAVIEGNDDIRSLITLGRIDVIIKGAEYAPGEIVGWDLVKQTVRVPMLAGWSTTGIIRGQT